jgi:multicomponent K+:H+ antiporter subunit G
LPAASRRRSFRRTRVTPKHGSPPASPLKTFYERVHPPTMGATLGTGLVLIGSMVFFTLHESRPVLHEIVIGVFMTLNTPVTYMLLVRAALHRDRTT